MTTAILLGTLLAGCGGVDSKIKASCDAKLDLERVLQEDHGGDAPEQTREECVRELQAARKEHERIGREGEFERDLEAGMERLKALKEECEGADRGEC